MYLKIISSHNTLDNLWLKGCTLKILKPLTNAVWCNLEITHSSCHAS